MSLAAGGRTGRQAHSHPCTRRHPRRPRGTHGTLAGTAPLEHRWLTRVNSYNAAVHFPRTAATLGRLYLR